jgi:hypothetical protein
MPGSALEEYSANYGAKLRAALNGQALGSALVADQNAPRGAPNGRPEMGDMNGMDPQRRSPLEGRQPGRGAYVPEQDPIVPMEPGGSADPEGGQDMGGPNAMPMQSELQGDPDQPPGSAMQKKGYGFRDMWKDAPEKAREKELTKLEASLKQGNQTIDEAYADLEKQMGARPDKKKLSRQEKGMLLMEFGLNVLANNKKGFGAIGQAGGQALKGYREISEGPQREYDATLGAVRGAKARDKVDLAKQSALEGVKVSKEQAMRLPGRFNGEDGTVYFYDEMGQVKQALDEKGNPIKGEVDKGGEGGRGFESESKYAKYMEIYGTDPNTGEPLTGLALQKAKQDALDFANDRGASIDDLDLDILAETSADKEMGADAYRDLTPEQRELRRNQIADARRKRLRRPMRSALEGRPEPRRGPPSGGKRRFASEADARAAFQRGEIQVNDIIIVNGVEGPVE